MGKVSNFMAGMAEYSSLLSSGYPVSSSSKIRLTKEDYMFKQKQNKKKKLKKLSKKSRQKNRKK